MKNQWMVGAICLLILLTLLPAAGSSAALQGPIIPRLYLPLLISVSRPVLQLQHLGCFASWCETGWYSSPALVDVNGDGRLDIVAGSYPLWAWDGQDGHQLWKAASSGGGRIWPDIVAADLDKCGAKEIVTANGSGYVTVYTLGGTVKWQARPLTSELRGLLAADLDGDNSNLELVVTAAVGSRTSTWVYNVTPTGLVIRSGWPQLGPSSAPYGWGVYNTNAAAANLDASDARLEIIVPNDTIYINGYKPDGAFLSANLTEYPDRPAWGQVAVYEDLAVEKRGWGDCTIGAGRTENFRPNFANSPAVIADLNGDGQPEVVVAGDVYDCSDGLNYPAQYIGPYIFNKDRTRFNSGGFDWRTPPQDTGAPLSTDWKVIETAVPNPVTADLDGDGRLEILYPSYDGRMHAFWLDKTEHGSWPYSVNIPGEGVIRFASEPVVADLDNNGKAEVIFTSWAQKTSLVPGQQLVGKLHILNYLGQPLWEVSLPGDLAGGLYNGALPAPTLGNVDGDPNLEIIINSINSGVLVYDLPNSSFARILWGTGRGSYLRSGAR